MSETHQLALGLLLAVQALEQAISPSATSAVPILLDAVLPVYPPIC
jgi:hypothetical protein